MLDVPPPSLLPFPHFIIFSAQRLLIVEIDSTFTFLISHSFIIQISGMI